MTVFKIKNRKEVFAWSLYDFANQPFTTIIVTFIYSAFFVKVIAENEQEGTFLWSMAIAITAIVVALLSPILGALADRGGYRKFFLITSTWICAIFSILLYFPNVGDVYYALSFFIIANIAFEMGSVFCNSYLPDLSSTDNIGRISGYAWGLGFVGGLIAMFLSFIFVVQPEKPIFNLDRLSSSNSIELKADSISENRIYVFSTLDPVAIKSGMYLKLKEKNNTEEVVVVKVKNNYLEFSEVIDDLYYLNNMFELYGTPIWMPDSKGNYSLLSPKDISFEIRTPVYRNDTLLGFKAYSEDGKIFLIDKDFCVKNNLDYDEISIISHKTTQNLRFNNIFIGLWFLIFSIPTFLFVKDRKREKLNKQHISSSFQSIAETFRSIAHYRKIYRFLIARLFFNDGLITIFALGGVYAVGTLDFTIEEVMMLGIVLNICAAAGSFLFGYIEDKIGANKVINISLFVLITATLIAYHSPDTTHPKEWFWVAGVLLGFMVGPNQSCSRSLMARLTPKEKQNEFFGFFALTGKATSFFGPLLFGIITKFYSQQMALWVVVVLLLIGLILFNRPDDKYTDIN
jgi:MFS-type transporter involved in bile tolerance (Atg22 family)